MEIIEGIHQQDNKHSKYLSISKGNLKLHDTKFQFGAGVDLFNKRKNVEDLGIFIIYIHIKQEASLQPYA